MRHEATEDAFRESSRMYEDLVSNIPVGVYRFRMKAAGGWQFDFVNSRFCELTGLNREDVLNNFETVFRLMHPDDLPAFISLIESVEKVPGPFAWEGRVIVDGQPRWMSVESRLTRMNNGDLVWSGYVTDITDRKRFEEDLQHSEEALKERERVWATLINNLPGFVYRCANDRDWTMEYVSHGCLKVTGYASEDFIGNNNLAYNDIVHPDYREPLWEKWQKLLINKGVFEEEYSIIAKGGETRWVWERGLGIFSNEGQLLFLEGFITDITDRKRAEDSIARQSAINESMAELSVRVLVVEDNLPVADLEQRFLSRARYTVIVATNGREALDIYESKKEEISLVVLDLLTPEMSGRDCLMELVKIDPSVNVLIASGYAPGDELHKEIRPLVKGFLQKPFAMPGLLISVRSVMGIDWNRDST